MSDARIARMFTHLRAALDAWEDILRNPYQQAATPPPAKPLPAPPMAPIPVQPVPEPAYASIKTWGAMSGMGRTAVYGAIAAGDLKAIKIGNSTRIDVTAGLAWLRSRPVAQLTTGQKRPPAGV